MEKAAADQSLFEFGIIASLFNHKLEIYSFTRICKDKRRASSRKVEKLLSIAMAEKSKKF